MSPDLSTEPFRCGGQHEEEVEVMGTACVTWPSMDTTGGLSTGIDHGISARGSV